MREYLNKLNILFTFFLHLYKCVKIFKEMSTKPMLDNGKKEFNHGDIMEISKRCGIRYHTVRRVMNGDLRSNKSSLVIAASTDYYKEKNEELTHAIAELNMILNRFDEFLLSAPAQKVILNMAQFIASQSNFEQKQP